MNYSFYVVLNISLILFELIHDFAHRYHIIMYTIHLLKYCA